MVRRAVGGGSSGGSAGGSSGGSASSGGNASAPSKSGVALSGTLSGTVGADGTLKLVFKGKSVKSLKAGRYKITVVDRSPNGSFVVRQVKHSPITVSGGAFVGTHSVTVDLEPGKWTFSTSGGKKSTGSFSVVA